MSPSVPSTLCPTCARTVFIPADDQPMGFFPFCSERCKLIDLGRWFDGKFQIPAVETDDDGGEEAAEIDPG